jgi:hypothetical protein
MALTDCRECGREISTTALACPHCGAPTRDGPRTEVEGTAGLGSGLAKRWNARKVLYIVAGVAVLGAIIAPALATAVIFTGIVYWAASQTLGPEGRAARSPAGSWTRRAQEFWQPLSIPVRIAVSAAIGLVLAFALGALGR